MIFCMKTVITAFGKGNAFLCRLSLINTRPSQKIKKALEKSGNKVVKQVTALVSWKALFQSRFVCKIRFSLQP